MADLPHIPVLRLGRDYESLDVTEVAGYADGAPRARVSQANSGMIKRDLRRMGDAARALRERSTEELLAISAKAGELFLDAELPLNDQGDTQTAEQYVEALSATSGLPHVLVRANMRKIHTALTGMEGVLRGLTRGLDLDVLDRGVGTQGGVPVSYGPTSDALGVVLPSNSPGVNSIWIPSLALKTPVVLKPGREEPWTPLRILRAFLAAGCPPEALGFYPTDHEGAATILAGCGRSQLFGDQRVTSTYASDPRIEIHGPGRSKVLLGEDELDRWEEHLDVLVSSVADNGGRSCINASSVFVPARGDEIAEALARALAEVAPQPPASEGARLSAFANPKMAEFCDATIASAVKAGTAVDVTAHVRGEGVERAVTAFGGSYLLPTVVRCDDLEAPLARTELLFPFTSVVEVPHERMAASMGPSLVVTAITREPKLTAELLASTDVERLNLGPIPTSRVEWDQPHEGNLFETLWERRAIQRAADW
ncbi:MAG: aldehyde dehydrogenase family protein [Planctomycetota bacterium]